MIIHMTQPELDSLADFLNREYEKRRRAARQQGKRYSMTAFARDVGIKQSTMSRLMKLGPDKSPVEGIDTQVLLALWDTFDKPLMEALRGDVEGVKRKKG